MEDRHFTAYDALSGATFFPKVLDWYPYPSRPCPICEQECAVVNAIHAQDHPEAFKAIYLCENDKCDFYDLAIKKCYARIYYSCEEALNAFETVFLRFERLSKD